ncbi:hypothetical protein Cfla_3607 [Cellulomonas flavigena DSM 20109]|uniref:Uncharacterized protein n=1 Tax=Cellulomonas flavigena (strain ATCC 482 / DSM 20109 / BCRC 11376 / JCM 18109 / NBRC 3775 / NCIMB 8073 / NRS 134) TaxID=446466 RepID=D5UDM2_CELFN|nr:hypothetical protein [Cellulomonas flavigena]ADG76478.1 hypothetical protein Cfla_3607 [Cellulomonas flavigena DSM 20109]
MYAFRGDFLRPPPAPAVDADTVLDEVRRALAGGRHVGVELVRARLVGAASGSGLSVMVYLTAPSQPRAERAFRRVVESLMVVGGSLAGWTFYDYREGRDALGGDPGAQR